MGSLSLRLARLLTGCFQHRSEERLCRWAKRRMSKYVTETFTRLERPDFAWRTLKSRLGSTITFGEKST